MLNSDEVAILEETNKRVFSVMRAISSLLKNVVSDLGVSEKEVVEVLERLKNLERAEIWRDVMWTKKDAYYVGKCYGRLEAVYSIILNVLRGDKHGSGHIEKA